jgi:formylglycine-generating enzyme
MVVGAGPDGQPLLPHMRFLSTPTIRGVFLLMLLIGLVAAALLGSARRAAPARCPDGLVDQGARCCAPGQVLDAGRCAGPPTSCPKGFDQTPRGCIVQAGRRHFASTTLSVGPDDWHGTGRALESVSVEAFALDVVEVTWDSYARCEASSACEPLASPGEPGAPVTGLSANAAARFCRYVGGRLPTRAEYWVAARGEEGRRFPWGPTGLVCRRATFGLSQGPCARGGTHPERAGARPDGASPEGIFDLVGNVAEWTVEPDGAIVARGGSFRSEVAAELSPLGKTAREPRDDVGLRCAYAP